MLVKCFLFRIIYFRVRAKFIFIFISQSNYLSSPILFHLQDKLKKANINLTEEVACETGDSHGTKSIGTENLLSRMNNSGSNTNSDQWENEGHENSSGKLYQLLDSSPRTTDAVAAGWSCQNWHSSACSFGTYLCPELPWR